MSFQINAISESRFATLFAMSDEQLRERNAVRVRVEQCPGTPCRISLEDTPVGEEVILLNYQHLPEDSPFQSSHAIFVRNNQRQARPAKDEVPAVIRSRVISVRGFDARHMMIEADLATGNEVARTINALFDNPAVDYIHLHNAKPGCFAASVVRI